MRAYSSEKLLFALGSEERAERLFGIGGLAQDRVAHAVKVVLGAAVNEIEGMIDAVRDGEEEAETLVVEMAEWAVVIVEHYGGALRYDVVGEMLRAFLCERRGMKETS